MISKNIKLFLAAALVFIVSTGMFAVDTLTVTAPNGGETWETGSTQTITWTSTGTMTEVKIWYSRDNGTNWITIESSTPNDGSYSWTVPNTPSPNCLVRIGDLDHDPDEVSAGTFSITAPLTAPFNRVSTGDIASDTGISYGVGWADYDNDGDADLYVANDTGSAGFLYQNNGDGTFTKITTGDIVTDDGPSRGVSWGDYNNDGYLDLFVANKDSDNFLYRNNGDGTFDKIITGVIVRDDGDSRAAMWGDANNDGYLDLFVANRNSYDYFYRNNGDGTFEKVTTGPVVTGYAAVTMGGGWADYDNDGWLDLYRTLESQSDNYLFHNNRDGTFSQVTNGDPVSDASSAMGCSWGDYDNDGDLDLFVSVDSSSSQGMANFLYRNNGGSTFQKITAGVIPTDTFDARASAWGDYDNDGDLDLFVVNYSGNNVLYRNEGGGNFNEITSGVLVSDGGASLGCGFADYDNDGDLDLYASNAGNQVNFLYQNQGNSNHWLHVRCLGSDGTAVGATVKVKAVINGETVWQYREISAQTGAYSQGTMDACFGLGDASTVQEVRVEFLSGVVRTLTNVAGDQVLSVSKHQDPGILVTAPNMGENWTSGTTHAITWTSSAAVTDVKLEYSMDNGLTYTNIVESTSNDGSYDWNVPDMPSTTCRVRISDTGGSGIADSSDFCFHIQAAPITNFSRVTTDPIVNTINNSNNILWGDYDNDGYPDALINIWYEGTNTLFHNDGDGTFTQITSSPITDDGNYSSNTGGSWGDYDNDGDLDLFVTRNENRNNFMYQNNGDGTFTRLTSVPMVSDGGHSYSSAWVDYDVDGDLDLFVANRGQANFLYRNDGGGTFTAITTGNFVTDTGGTIGCSWCDYDRDGDPDLFLANTDSQANTLYRNDGGGVFTEITSGQIVTDTASTRAGSWGDYNNDGFPDLYVSNLDQDNWLYRNNGDGTFTKETEGELAGQPGGNAYDALWMDHDNDGDLDLFVINYAEKNFVFRNHGGLYFTKDTDFEFATDTGDSKGIASADINRDGFLDFLVLNYGAENLLYTNTGTGNHWLQVRCAGNPSNRSAIGARVIVTAVIDGNVVRQVRDISGQSNYKAQSTLVASFGLGDASVVDQLQIIWPSGSIQTMTNITVDQLLNITETPDTTDAVYLVSPNGNQNWDAGTVQYITWISSGSIANVKLEYSSDNGGTWTDITASTANTGSYSWTVPSIDSGNCLVRISDTDGVPSDTSDAPFTIVVPGIDVVVPNGGERWDVGTPHDITWTTTGTVGNVKIEYSNDNGSTYTTIIASTTNDGLYSWTVPSTAVVSSSCLIRISEDGGTVEDESDNVFAITPIIAITSPQSGDQWEADSTHAVTWSITGTVSGNIILEYSIDNGANYSTIATTANDGSFEWLVPEGASNECLLRILDTDNNVYDISGMFEIQAASGTEIFERVTVGDIVTDGGTSFSSTWGDSDGDGYPDLYVANYSYEKNFLYHNAGNGTFEEITGDPVVTDLDASVDAVWGDYDGDGDLDLFIANNNNKTNRLYRNDGDGTFTKLTDTTSFPMVGHTGNSYSAAWVDYDNDGDLDLFVANRSQVNYLYRNKGDGTFQNAPTNAIISDTGSTIDASWCDYDNDGDMDLFLSNYDSQKNSLHRNDGGGTFVKITTSGEPIVNDTGNSAGGAWGDYDNDGYPDLYVSNFGAANCLYHNDGDGTFTKVTTGDIVTDVTDSGGGIWGDFDNDGDLDLFVANRGQSNCLYWNDGDGTFTKMLTGAIITDTDDTRGAAWADYDRDGDLDIFVAVSAGGNNVLYRNRGNANHWLQLRFTGTDSVRSAVGVKVKVKAVIDGSSIWQYREISGDGSNYGQNEMIAHFGLKDASSVQEIRVEWPSGNIQTLTDVAVDQLLTITEAADAGTITVSSPNGGETLQAGNVFTVTWSSTGNVGDVSIEYSTDGGSNYTSIIASTANDGSYDWTVPESASATCLIRVKEATGDVEDVSDAGFTIVIPQIETITLVSPNGGETWDVGEAHAITWTSAGNMANVKIEYTSDGGSTWNEVAASVSNSGTYNWTVPNSPSSTVKVRVSDAADGDPIDASDADFTITLPTITVTSPNGGETWIVGSEKNITWNSSGTIENVKIEYSTDSGTLWTEIISSATNNGSYTWSVPDNVSENCLMKISDANGNFSDISDEVFTISTASINVTYPNGSENLGRGSSIDITWNSNGINQNVKIILLKDSTVVGEITSDTMGSTSRYTWSVSEIAGGQVDNGTGYQVRVETWDGTIGDTSDDTFQISAVPVTITISSPADNAVLNTAAVINGKVEGSAPSRVNIGTVDAEIIGSNFIFNAFTLNEGINPLTLNAADNYGNTAETQLTLFLDTVAPQITITSPANGIILSQRTTVVQGTVSDERLNEVRVNGSVCNIENGTFALSVNLIEGSNTIQVTADDMAGNTSGSQIIVTVDDLPPLINVTSPTNNAYVSTSTVTITGRADDPNLVSVKINGNNAVLSGNSFTFSGLALEEGSNQVTIEAEDNAGNLNSITHTINLDTQAPEIINVMPSAGSSNLPLNTTIQVEFSEKINLSTLTNETLYLEDQAQQKITGSYQLTDNTALFTPSLLPSNAVLSLHVTAGIKDFAGHAVSNPYSGTFSTKDDVPPAAPAVQAIPEKTSLSTITISGSSDNGAIINVTGGASPVETTCETDGTFTVDVPLQKDRLNQLLITATDEAGNTSLPASLSIYQESSEFTVSGAVLAENQVSVDFSKPIDAATLTSANFIVTTASGVVTGTITVSGDGKQGVFSGTLSASEMVKIDITTGVKDSEGISLSFPFTKIFNQAGADVIAQGEVYDDGTGSPIGGAMVTLVSVNGTPPADPAPAALTTSEGIYVLPLPEGNCVLRITKEGYTSSDRIIQAVPGFSGQLFDARIRPLDGEEKTLPVAGGTLIFNLSSTGTEVSTIAALICGDNAVSQETSIRVTAVGSQSLQGRTPLGWSPICAMDIRSDEPPSQGNLFAIPVTLRVTNYWSNLDGLSVVLAHWDESEAQWIAISMAVISPENLSGTLEKAGQYAFLIKDTVPTAPANAVIGQPVPAVTGSSVPANSEIDADLTFKPSEIFPADTSTATLQITTKNNGPGLISSGVPVQAHVTETYEFLNNSTVGFKPSTVDLTAYNYGSNITKVVFNLSADSKISVSDLKLGTIHTGMLRYNDTLQGVIVGVEGGTVTGDGGAEITVEPGSVTKPTAVAIRKVESEELTMPLPDNFEVLGAVELSLAGETLTQSATLALALEQAVIDNMPSDAQLLAVRLAKTDLGYGWVLQSQCLIDQGKVKTTMANAALVPFPGITQGGTYLFLRALSPMGFIKGTVNFGGQVLSGALVSVDSHELLAFSGSNYTQVGFLGTVNLKALHLVTRDEATASDTLQVTDEVITVNIGISESGPSILSITPVSSAEDVPVTSTITFIFSKAIDAATFNAQNVYIKEGTVTVGGVFKLSSGGTQGEFIPNGDFTSEKRVDITVTTGLKDLGGHALAGVYSSYFTVEDTTPPEVDVSKIKCLLPENGIAHITGEAGAVAPGTSVSALNTRTNQTVTVSALSDGSFDLSISAEYNDIIEISIIDAAANEVKLLDVPFSSADGNRVVMDSRAQTFINPNTGFGIRVEEGTFNGPVIVGVYQELNTSLLAAEPEGYQRLAAIRIDLNGVVPNKPFKISMPLPDGVPADSLVFAAREVLPFGMKKLMVVAHTAITNGRIETISQTPWPECDREAVYSVLLNPTKQVAYISGLATGPGQVISVLDLVFITGPGSLSCIIPVRIQSTVQLDALPMARTFSAMSLTADSATAAADSGDGSSESSGDMTVKAQDEDTGEVLFERILDLLTEAGQTYDIGPMADDKEPPVLNSITGLFTVNFKVSAAPAVSLGITMEPQVSGGTVENISLSAVKNTSVNVTGKDDGDEAPGKVRVYKAGKSDELRSFNADRDGGFDNQTVAAKIGDRVYISVEQGDIAPNHEFKLFFSEPLTDPGDNENIIKIIDVEDSEAEPEKLYVKLLDNKTELYVRPRTQLKEGTRYTLEINRLTDLSGNEFWYKCDFRTRGTGRIGYMGNLTDVNDSVVLGGYLYVANGASGLAILDISNPKEPKKVGSYNQFTGDARGLAAYGEDSGETDAPNRRLVVVGGGVRAMGFIETLDLTKPLEPTLQGHVHISRMRGTTGHLVCEGVPKSVVILGKYAYIPIFGGGLTIVDMDILNDSTMDAVLARVGFYEQENALDVKVYKKDERVLAVLLVQHNGIEIIDCTDPAHPFSVAEHFVTESRAMGALEIAPDFQVDENNDGKYDKTEKKDLVFFSYASLPKVLVVDITNASVPIAFREINMKDSGGVVDMVLSEQAKTLVMSDMELGVVMLDVTFAESDEYIDNSQDRILGKVSTTNSPKTGLILDEDLNLAYVGTSEGFQEASINTLMLKRANIVLVYKKEGETDPDAYKEVVKIAPEGIKEADNPEKYPNTVYVMAMLPGGVGKEIKADMWSLNAYGANLPPASEKLNTYLKDLTLYRKSDNQTSRYYNVFLSKPIKVTVKANEGPGLDEIKILSGDWLKVNLTKSLAQKLPYMTEEECEFISDKRRSIRADLFDREENFMENEEEKPNSPANNPFIYSNVMVHTGEFVNTSTDLYVPGRSFDFAFTRTYRSQAIYSGVLGWGWDHIFNIRLMELDTGDIILYDGTGRRERFKAKKNDSVITGYTSPDGWFTELKKTGDGNFRLIFPDRTIQFFDDYGCLTRIQDRNHNKMEFYYNPTGQLMAVMDDMGRIYSFEYYPFEYRPDDEKKLKSDSGRLKEVSDFAGRKVEYKYDADTGDLIEVDMNTGDMTGVPSMSRIKKYLYVRDEDNLEAAHNLEKLTDPRGVANYGDVPYLTITYTSDDKVDAQNFVELPQPVDFSVGDAVTTVKEAKGNSKSFAFQEDDLQRTVTNGGKSTIINLNEDGLVTNITYPKGNIVTFEYFAASEDLRRSAGNLVKVTSSGDPGPISASYEYENYFNQVTSITDPRNNKTFIGRDAHGNVVTVTPPGTGPYVYDYYSSGDPELYGVLHTITNPEGSVTEYEYYPENAPSGDGSSTPWNRAMVGNFGGYLKQVTVDKDGVNIASEYVYDKLGNVTSNTDGEGVKTTYQYNNPFGLLNTLIQGATAADDGAFAANLTTTFVYDANGNVDLETSSTGIAIDYGYDRLDRMTSKSYQGGDVQMEYEFKYDDNSNLQEVTYPDKVRKDTFTYNSRDLLETKSSGSGGDSSTVTYEYDDNGQLQYFYDGRQKKYSFEYDGHGRLKSAKDPLENQVTYTYDENSNVETVDALGADGKALHQKYVYNLLNLVTEQRLNKDGGEIVTRFGYNNAGILTSVTPPANSPDTSKWVITPNGAGLTSVLTDPVGNIDGFTYDKRGWVKGSTEIEFNGQSLHKSVKHTVLGGTREIGDSIHRDYNYEYNTTKQVLDTVEDPEGGLVTYTYDGLNRVKYVTRHVNYDKSSSKATTEYKYHPNGTLSQIIDADKNITSYVYDTKDRLTDIFYPNTPGSLQFTYNENDQIETRKDLNNTMVTNEYDAASRLTRRTIEPGEGVEGCTSENFDYDGLGRLIKAENNDSTITFDYNTAGRLIKETQNIKDEVDNIIATYEVGYEYDDNGNVTKLTYPSKVNPSDTGSQKKEVIFTPDALDRIDTITSGEKAIADYDYEGKSKVVSKNLSNGKVVMTSVYDNGKRPTSLIYKSGETTHFSRTMTWNLMDMKLTDAGLDIAKEFKYDTALRLRKEDNKKGNSIIESFNFAIDSVENLTDISASKLGKFELSLTTKKNERHQYTSVDYAQTVNNQTLSIHVAPSYDNNGNMKSFVHQYTYNYGNQLIRVETGTGLNVKYRYDALGRRIEKIVTDPNGEYITRYVYDGWRVIEERDQHDIVLKRYTYGIGIDERVEMEFRNVSGGFDIYLPMQDTTGNVIGIADSAGKLVEKYTYSAYGSPVFGYDSVPPKIENARFEDDKIITQLTEPIDPATAADTITASHEGTDIGGTTEVSADGRELIFNPYESLPEGSIMLAVKKVKDVAGNESESEFYQEIYYQRETTFVVYDESPPEVDSIEKNGKDIIVTYSENIDPNTISESLEITKGGGSVSGSLTQISNREVKFTVDDIFEERQEYQIWVKSVLKDLSGKSINEFFHNFVVMNDEMLIFEKDDPNRNSKSRIGNDHLFHGRTYEPEVGLYYYRHRYYLPRIGRFLQNDPMGYTDSMNMYQAFNQNPVNFVDPMGDVVNPVLVDHYGYSESIARHNVGVTYLRFRESGDNHSEAYNKLIDYNFIIDNGTEDDLNFAKELRYSYLKSIWKIPFRRKTAGEAVSDLTAGFGDTISERVTDALMSCLFGHGTKKPKIVPTKIARHALQKILGLGEIKDMVNYNSAYYDMGKWGWDLTVLTTTGLYSTFGTTPTIASVETYSGTAVNPAAIRQMKMFKDDVGYNISPEMVFNQYKSIGRNGTFITDSTTFDLALGRELANTKFKVGLFSGPGKVSYLQAFKISRSLGLNRTSLFGGFRLTLVKGVSKMHPRSPMPSIGNKYFLGPGKGLPNGSPEMVIDSVETW